MMHRRHRVVAAASVVAASLVLVSCGSRLDQQQLSAGARGGAPVSLGGSEVGTGTGTGSTVGSGSGTGDGPVSVSGGGSVSGSGGAGATTQGGAGGHSAGGGSSTGSGSGTSGKSAGSGGGSSAGPVGSKLQSDGQPITVCGVDELSGPVGATAAQGPAAVKAWAADVNSNGGVAGHRINLVIKDSQSDPSTARSDAQACIANDHAVAFVDDIMPLTLNNIEPLLQSAGVPAVGGDCGAAGWNQYAILWNQCMSTDSSYWALPAEVRRMHVANKRWAFLYCAESSGCSDAKKAEVDGGYARKQGVTLAYSAQVSLTQLDFSSECAAMKRARVGVVSAIIDPASYERLGQSCARQGYYPFYLLEQGEAIPKLQTYPGLRNIRVILTSFPFAGVQGGVSAQFATVWSRYGDGTPAGAEATNGYAASLMFQFLVEQAAKTDAHITAASLLKVEGKVSHNTFGGALPPITLRPRKPTPDNGCWFVVQATNGGAWRAPQGSRVTCRH